ncbi:hypothetical protein Hamer_G027081 [Homarus americanus]|uniref:Uncharacterized protein n=1 Tax=Homarus americanus TaxID=6706 RepID=A0A8J5MKJ9_HOMAM|nr:hypothetical protein Hamer_G027081 [Homarus americanus]
MKMTARWVRLCVVAVSLLMYATSMTEVPSITSYKVVPKFPNELTRYCLLEEVILGAASTYLWAMECLLYCLRGQCCLVYSLFNLLQIMIL